MWHIKIAKTIRENNFGHVPFRWYDKITMCMKEVECEGDHTKLS
jgi:hypothetical protein